MADSAGRTNARAEDAAGGSGADGPAPADEAEGAGGEEHGEGSGGGADIVARVLLQWHQAYPGLDTSPMGVIGRLNRCAELLQHATDAPLTHEGLSRAEFDILGALRRVDRELTPGRLARETFASGAAVTKRLKELERRGLVARRADGRDRRVVHLSLTEDGRTLIDRLLPEQLGYEASLLGGLGVARREELAGSLARLLVLLEGRLGGHLGRV